MKRRIVQEQCWRRPPSWPQRSRLRASQPRRHPRRAGLLGRAAQRAAEVRESQEPGDQGSLTAELRRQAVDRAVAGVMGSVDAEGLEAVPDRVVTRALGSADGAVLEQALDRAGWPEFWGWMVISARSSGWSARMLERLWDWR